MAGKIAKIGNYFLYLLTITAGLFICNGEVLFGDNPTQKFTGNDVRLYTGIFLVSLVTLFLINIFRKKYKPNWILLSLFLIVAVGNIVGIATFKDYGYYVFDGIEGGSYAFTYYIDLETRLIFSLEALVLCLTCFVLIDFGYQLFELDEFLKVVAFTTLTIISIFMVISFVVDWDCYANFWQNYFVTDHSFMRFPKSVFMNSNVFAIMLSVAFIALIYLHHFYKRWFFFIPMIVLYVNIFMTNCRTLTISVLLLFLAYLVYYLLDKYGKTRKRKIITASLIASIFVTSIIVTTVVLVLTNNLDNFIDFMLESYNFRSIHSRSWIWMRTIESINLANWFTGVGFNLFGEILIRFNVTDPTSARPNNNTSTHNAALEYLGNGGILMLVVVLIILGMLIYMAIKNLKNNRGLMVLSLMLIVFSLIYSIIESGFFIFPRTYGFAILTAFIVVPIVSTEAKYHVKKVK